MEKKRNLQGLANEQRLLHKFMPTQRIAQRLGLCHFRIMRRSGWRGAEITKFALAFARAGNAVCVHGPNNGIPKKQASSARKVEGFHRQSFRIIVNQYPPHCFKYQVSHNRRCVPHRRAPKPVSILRVCVTKIGPVSATMHSPNAL